MTGNLSDDLDPYGEKTLQVISRADHFNQWMFDTISPFCSGKTLEIGSGIGNISSYFLNSGYALTLSDIRDHYCEELKKKFSGFKNLDNIINLDLIDPSFEEKYSNSKNFFDSIFVLNVVEHIENDSLAIANCRYLLKKGGHLVILVPAFQALFNKFDENLGHYRRYNQNSLDQLLKKNGYEIIHHQYFNLAGIPGWYFSGKILKNKTIPEGQMGLYNMLVPLFKLADKIFMNVSGLSVIAVGKVL
jgi:SAM-dependent methyltransferase